MHKCEKTEKNTTFFFRFVLFSSFKQANDKNGIKEHEWRTPSELNKMKLMNKFRKCYSFSLSFIFIIFILIFMFNAISWMLCAMCPSYLLQSFARSFDISFIVLFCSFVDMIKHHFIRIWQAAVDGWHTPTSAKSLLLILSLLLLLLLLLLWDLKSVFHSRTIPIKADARKQIQITKENEYKKFFFHFILCSQWNPVSSCRFIFWSYSSLDPQFTLVHYKCPFISLSLQMFHSYYLFVASLKFLFFSNEY